MAVEGRGHVAARRAGKEADRAAGVVDPAPQVDHCVTQRVVDGPGGHRLDAGRLEVRHRRAVRIVPHGPRAHPHQSCGRRGAQRGGVDLVDHRRHQGLGTVLDRPGDDRTRDLPPESGTETVVLEPVVEVEALVVGVLVPQTGPPDDVIRRAVDDDGIPQPVPLPVDEVGRQSLAALLRARHARRRVRIRPWVVVHAHVVVKVLGARSPQREPLGRQPDGAFAGRRVHGTCRSGARVSQAARGAPSQQGSM